MTSEALFARNSRCGCGVKRDLQAAGAHGERRTRAREYRSLVQSPSYCLGPRPVVLEDRTVSTMDQQTNTAAWAQDPRNFAGRRVDIAIFEAELARHRVEPGVGKGKRFHRHPRAYLRSARGRRKLRSEIGAGELEIAPTCQHPFEHPAVARGQIEQLRRPGQFGDKIVPDSLLRVLDAATALGQATAAGQSAIAARVVGPKFRPWAAAGRAVAGHGLRPSKGTTSKATVIRSPVPNDVVPW